MFAAIRQWVIKTMMKGNTGVVQTMPKQQIIEMNVQITAERIMRNGINPEDLKSVGQVENVVKQIEQPKVNVNPGMTSVKKADVFDMEGNKIPEGSGIMGGKAVPGTSSREKVKKEAVEKYGFTPKKFDETMDSQFDEKIGDDLLKAEMDASNQKGIAGIKNNRQMNADELEDFENEIGGNLEAYDFDGTVGSARNILKEQKKYEADMFAEYKSIGGSKRPGGPKASERDRMPIRLMKNFEKELNEVDLMAEGYSKDQANILIKARKKMTSGDEMNPNESLTRVKEEFADEAGVDVDDFTDIDFEIDTPDYAKGGRAGYYGGGMTNSSETDLSDIGHGGDALNSRTRLLSPGSQATTSTGLNYLLGDDNDNTRVPFAGGGMGKRAFLKFLASGAAGIAGLKTGLFGVGKKEVAKEVVKEAATSGGVPPYFFKLVNKIKTLGDNVTETAATADRQSVKQYKDYTLTEDVSTGSIEILKKERGGFREDVYMSYKVDDVPLRGKKKSTKTEEYEEYTARPDQDGKMRDIEQGVPDSVVMEVEAGSGNVPESFYTGPNPIKKADGGRIGLFMGGGLLAGKGLTKEMLKFMTKGSANAKSPAGILKMMNPKQFEKLLDNPSYTGKISPATGETADQMILDMIKKTKEDRSSMIGDLIGSARKVKKVDDDIIAYKKKIIKDMMAKGINENEARGFADLMAKEMKEAAAPQLTSSPPKVTEQGLLELENIQKNLLTRGRQLQSSGGLATMLGE